MQWSQAGTKAALMLFGEKYLERLPKGTSDEAHQYLRLSNKYMRRSFQKAAPFRRRIWLIPHECLSSW